MANRIAAELRGDDGRFGGAVDNGSRGLVAFLFTDLEESTRHWEQDPGRMPDAYALHDDLLRAAVAAYGGVVYKVIGDAFQIAFPNAMAAVQAAATAQRALTAASWPTTEPLRVRMALHLCPAEPEPSGDYRTPNLNRLGRLLAVGHGGQVLLSAAIGDAVSAALPAEIRIVDLGRHRLRDLPGTEQIGQIAASGLWQEFPPLKSLPQHVHNLDPEATPFVGREAQIETIAGLLESDSRRLVTLTGPGGVGKTRLSREVARRLAPRVPAGVWWVSLATVTQHEAMLTAIATTLGLRDVSERSPLDAIAAWLADQEVVLVLDNLEQIAGAAAPISTLLTTCSRLRILATSRAPLRIAAEREVTVPPFAVPAERITWTAASAGELEAVRLFVERAQAVRADFTLTDDNATPIVMICRRLDGLPLAIELAAARVRALPPATLLARLEPALPLLTQGPKDAPERLRTMRHAIAWSVALLPPATRDVFARLAVLVGGATLEAAEAITAGESLHATDQDETDYIANLAEQSLIRIADHSSGPRVEMLETIREYARELLHASGDEQAIRERHARWFFARAVEAKARFGSPGETDALDLIERDHDNYQAALTWLTENDPAAAVQLAAILAHLWQTRSQLHAARPALHAVLAVADHATPVDRARLSVAAARLAEADGEFDEAAGRYHEALALARAEGDDFTICQSLEGLGGMAQDQGRFHEARHFHEEVMTISARVGDDQGVAHALLNLGAIAAMRGDAPAARAHMDRALQILRRLGNAHGIAASLTNLGTLVFDAGDLAAATQIWNEALALWTRVNSPTMIAVVLANLGEAAMMSGEAERAATYLRQAHDLHQDIGDRRALAADLAGLGYTSMIAGDRLSARRHLADALHLAREQRHPLAEAFIVETMAMIAMQEGLAALAARLLGVANGIRTTHDVPLAPVYRPALERTATAARVALGDDAFTQALASGPLSVDVAREAMLPC